MTKSLALSSRVRVSLLAGALALATVPAAFAQHGGGGGGGSHGGGGGSHGGSSGGSHGTGAWHGGGANHGGGWHGGGYRGGHGYYGGRGYYYRPGGWGWGWGWGWGAGWGWGWPGYWGGGYYAPGGYVGVSPYVSLSPGAWAVVNTDVSPETTRVFLDGVFIGMADDFDGPEYLYVKKGDYKLEFRLDGFETKTVDLEARAGARIKISEKLKKIPGAAQYGSYDNPEPEGGVQRFWSKEKSNQPHPVDVQGGAQGDQPDTIQAQGRSWRGNDQPPSSEPAPESGPAPSGEGSEVQVAPPASAQGAGVAPNSRARIVFRIQPADAAVYLNNHFVGTGEELSTLTRGLQVPPGQHTITVSRPGLTTDEQTVVVGPGKSETVEISLKP